MEFEADPGMDTFMDPTAEYEVDPDADVASSRSSLPRCPVVNFERDGDSISAIPRVTTDTAGIAARVRAVDDAFYLEEYSSRSLHFSAKTGAWELEPIEPIVIRPSERQRARRREQSSSGSSFGSQGSPTSHTSSWSSSGRDDRSSGRSRRSSGRRKGGSPRQRSSSRAGSDSVGSVMTPVLSAASSPPSPTSSSSTGRSVTDLPTSRESAGTRPAHSDLLPGTVGGPKLDILAGFDNESRCSDYIEEEDTIPPGCALPDENPGKAEASRKHSLLHRDAVRTRSSSGNDTSELKGARTMWSCIWPEQPRAARPSHGRDGQDNDSSMRAGFRRFFSLRGSMRRFGGDRPRRLLRQERLAHSSSSSSIATITPQGTAPIARRLAQRASASTPTRKLGPSADRAAPPSATQTQPKRAVFPRRASNRSRSSDRPRKTPDLDLAFKDVGQRVEEINVAREPVSVPWAGDQSCAFSLEDLDSGNERGLWSAGAHHSWRTRLSSLSGLVESSGGSACNEARVSKTGDEYLKFADGASVRSRGRWAMH